ncbi:MAG TPA: ABC transporter permease, partial [Archaeoglobus profundus]|nr:ABC transporter permease [Archaeoglobus profundus]
MEWSIIPEIVLRSLKVSGLATILASMIGIPIGILISLTNFKG